LKFWIKNLIVSFALATIVTACGTTPDRVPPGVVLAALDAELAAQCIGRIRRSDVPVIPEGSVRPGERDTAIYIRKLEDGYEICERVVREGVAAGNVQ
jgi:hypothetical protein